MSAGQHMAESLNHALQSAIEALQCAKRGHCDHAMADEAIAALERQITKRSELQEGAANAWVGRVRIDSGEVHIVPRERNAEASSLADGQRVYAAAQQGIHETVGPELITELFRSGLRSTPRSALQWFEAGVRALEVHQTAVAATSRANGGAT